MDKYKKDINEAQIKWILQEIKKARAQGMEVMIDGIYCKNPEEEKTLLVVREEETFMQDYIGDDNGNIIGIAFDKIKIKNK
ncbi:hypothetical protein [Velocimicrobium porci]|uniref:Uncharacterized protein n=1 Tax=Velocimicrobium porci TaxID=2606634 RepID=A0A6L5XX29_9FIRM|nr:hypothetical protein [Velocimicrobium porci]MSS62898.1 hypothetical protein [Velocimicrobium porci]